MEEELRMVLCFVLAPDPVVADNVARVMEPGGVIMYEILLVMP